MAELRIVTKSFLRRALNRIRDLRHDIALQNRLLDQQCATIIDLQRQLRGFRDKKGRFTRQSGA